MFCVQAVQVVQAVASHAQKEVRDGNHSVSNQRRKPVRLNLETENSVSKKSIKNIFDS